MRPNALKQRGGDTVVLEQVTTHLRRMGHEVEIDLEQKKDPADFDIAHLYNFATPEITESLARRCVERKTKFVVTTLYEDWPSFFNQMVVQELALTGYVKFGQPSQEWQRFRDLTQRTTRSEIQDNTFTALTAQVLMSSGHSESVILRRDYTDANSIEVCSFGSEISPYSDGGKLFREKTGVKDYILCVGRLEQRKNQLALLKAFEDSPHTIIFAAGGFSYEPDYEAVCRNFKRVGTNIFLGRMEADVLASAYEGAMCHALPSWYELPGLVSLEAAARGTAVVASDFGTIRDYLGDDGVYCHPGKTDSIRMAVEKAITVGPNPELKERVQKFTWKRSAERLVELYELALSMDRVTPSGELLTRKRKESDHTDLNATFQEFPSLLKIIKGRLKSQSNQA